LRLQKKSGCIDSHLIHSESVIPFDKINNCETIGVSSGASAPEILVRNFLDQLNNKYQLEIKQVEIIKEDIVFNVPKKIKLMAVYTKINHSDILSINKNFPIEKITSFVGIKKGIENTNYLLKTKNNKYILTIFEKRVANKDVPFFMKLMDLLNSKKINCPKPIKNLEDEYLIKIKGKLACIVTFLDGKDKKVLTTNNCYQVGMIIGKMHKITNKFKIKKRKFNGYEKYAKTSKKYKF
jgi:hypothetical protein